MRITLFLAATFVASSLSAQVVNVAVQPASPTTASLITIEVEAFDPCEPVTLSRNGDVFRVDVPSTCVIVLPLTARTTLQVGQLPAGTYTYQVYVDNVFDRGGTFVVTAAAHTAAVPALSPSALALLAMLMTTAGWIALRRL
ncbi:MAG TPA: hypothetical protein VF846_19845 [Thermoanaerobaculia bacterium]